MKLDKDGKLDYFSRKTFEVLQEYGWDVEKMADDIIVLRDEISDLHEAAEKET